MRTIETLRRILPNSVVLWKPELREVKGLAQSHTASMCTELKATCFHYTALPGRDLMLAFPSGLLEAEMPYPKGQQSLVGAFNSLSEATRSKATPSGPEKGGRWLEKCTCIYVDSETPPHWLVLSSHTHLG